MAAPLLAGDVGGTKTALRLQGDGGAILKQEKFESAKYGDLSNIVVEFLSKSDTPRPEWGKSPFAGASGDGITATAESPPRPENWRGTPARKGRSLPIVQ